MIVEGEKFVGRVTVEVELANNVDVTLAHLGQLTPEQVRRVKVQGLVDSGATRLVIPQSLADRLGLQVGGEMQVRYADGRTAIRRIAQGIQLKYAGRESLFNAIVEPGRDSVLIGAIVMEDLDLIVDCARQQLVPRDPEHWISEIE
jgi:predicted aspartyl protease